MDEMERLCHAGLPSGGSVPVQEPSDGYESTLLQSAATCIPPCARQFLENALGFLW